MKSHIHVLHVLHVLHECTTCSACTTARVQYTYVYTRSPHGYISKKLIYFHDSYSHKNTCTPIQVCAQHSIIIQVHVFSHISYLYWYPVLVPCTGPNTVLHSMSVVQVYSTGTGYRYQKYFFSKTQETKQTTCYGVRVPLQRYIKFYKLML